jgi:hypothetical protein
MTTTKLQNKVLAELIRMGNTEKESNKMIKLHFNNAIYLKTARNIALYITA